MKSPSSSVGIIESDGMRNGSNRNERISSTIRITGKNERAYSTTTGSRTLSGAPPLAVTAATRCGLNSQLSTPQMTPVSTVAATRMKEKSKIIAYFSLPTCNTARNASCGISTEPICFMRFLPSFCFSRSLRLREMSPP